MSAAESFRTRISRRSWHKLAAALARGATMRSARAADSTLHRPIPNPADLLPVAGLGTWQVFDVAGEATDTAQPRETLRIFVGLGGRVIDSSPMSGSSESVTGELADELG